GIASTRRYKNGLRTIISSPYILGIASMVGLYEMVSAIMDYQFTSTVLHFVSGEQLKVHFASVYYFTNFISLILQLFLTTLIMTRFGIATALLFLPVTIMIGESAFILLPGLLLGSLLNTIDNAFSYSINQSAKEVLYVPVEREEKYQAKAFIDIFILRCAKGIAVAFSLMLTLIFAGFEGMRWLSLIVLGLLFIWLAVIRYIGQSYKKMEKT
ncbi:MAG: Npt1/Npt2 family nucleotide transporter, partial [Nitrospinota bacterium]